MKQSCNGFTGVNFPGSPRVLPLSLHLHSQTDRAAPGGEEERTRTMFWRPSASDSLFCLFFFLQGYQKAILGKEEIGKKCFPFSTLSLLERNRCGVWEHGPKRSRVYGQEQWAPSLGIVCIHLRFPPDLSNQHNKPPKSLFIQTRSLKSTPVHSSWWKLKEEKPR